MSPPARRLPLLVVVVAVLALVGVLAGGEGSAGPSVFEVATDTPAVPDDDQSSFRAGETPAVVQVTTNRVRPLGQAIALIVVPAASFAALATGRRLPAVPTPVRRRVAGLRHVRRRGPPALLVA